jgi:hypothetical protein
MLTYEQTRLTHLEEVSALVAAGVNPDENTWDEAAYNAAGIALDAAQAEKVKRLTLHKTHPGD